MGRYNELEFQGFFVLRRDVNIESIMDFEKPYLQHSTNLGYEEGESEKRKQIGE
jgi:hypothetical protein